MPDINALTNEQLYTVYTAPQDEASKQMALVEMARRTNMMRDFTASIGRPKGVRYITEISISSRFRQYNLTADRACLTW